MNLIVMHENLIYISFIYIIYYFSLNFKLLYLNILQMCSFFHSKIFQKFKYLIKTIFTILLNTLDLKIHVFL